MAQRRYGPTRGAGVAIIEKEGDKTIEPAALGMVGYAGVLERGPVGELIIALTKADFEAQCGGYIDDSLLPDNCFDYYDLANGAGGILLVRVTDGNEVQASIPVYTRQDPRTQLGTIKAHNGGRWGGKAQYQTAETPTDVATDITDTTVDTGLTMSTDEFKGGTLQLDGLPNVTFNITGNDDTGLVTLEADDTALTQLLAGADPTNNRFYLILENEAKEVSVEFGDGDENPTSEFSLNVYLDGALVRNYDNLSINPSSGRYWVDVINEDGSNFYIEAEDVFTGSRVASARPANHWGAFTAITATVLTATIHEFAINSVGGGDPTFALGTTTDSHLAQTITLTMSDATNFTASSDKFGDLGSGTLGTLFEPNNKWTPSFTVTAGSNPLAAADTLVITYKPFVPDELIDGLLYPDPDVDRRLSYRIVDNNHNTITVASGSDMATDVPVDAGTAASGSIQYVAQANFVDGETFVLDDGETPPITFHIDQTGTYTPGGGYDATNIQVDISGDTTADDVAATALTAINGVASLKITAGAATAGLQPLTADEVGAQANNAILETVADAGFIVTGLSNGVDATDDSFRVQSLTPLAGGKDGNADISDTNYSDQAWDTADSPFNDVIGKNLGLIKMATPGVTSTAVQKAGVAYAEAKNHQYRYEAPSNITTEAGADTYFNDTLGRNDFAVCSWPSYGYVPDPDSTDGKLKLISLTGMIHGREARIAANFDGYHKAEAGIDATLPRLLKIPTGDKTLNEEFLNPLGINVIKKVRGNFILWGDRTLYLDPTWKWKHQREQMSYYEHVLQENFDFIVFAINDPETQEVAITTLTAFFIPEFVKRALRGDKFTDAAIIKVDNENNTDLTRANGDLFADISLRLADTVERFIIRIGKQGIFESVA